jgi:PPK2 family polyphosphate:nucleotide phosphotransferase
LASQDLTPVLFRRSCREREWNAGSQFSGYDEPVFTAGFKKEETMKINHESFRVREGEKVDLKKWSTRVKPLCTSKEDYEDVAEDHLAQLRNLQELLYADNRYSLLLIFQAMDAAGKDGAIKHVMSGINPQGCQVYSFKQPSLEERQHDFLWRTSRRLPERGRIGIFNRSYYEEVLITRVHPDLLDAERIPEEGLDSGRVWEGRYRSIVESEKHLHRNGTRILKFFLHLSKEEQRKRFLERLENPQKNWKFSLSDLREREYWKDYQKAYAECLGTTSSKQAPWYVVPADRKKDARLIISSVILEALRGLKMSYPKPDKKRRKELQITHQMLMKEGKAGPKGKSSEED